MTEHLFAPILAGHIPPGTTPEQAALFADAADNAATKGGDPTWVDIAEAWRRAERDLRAE